MTAARGVPAGEGDKTAIRPVVSSERFLAAAGLLCLIVLGVVLRLVPTVFVPSINWGDEIFQTVEPAHRLVFGYGLVPWEFQLGMRSWLLPGVIAGLTGYINTGRLARAVLEATAWQTREVVEAINADFGSDLSELRVDGGMTPRTTC